MELFIGAIVLGVIPALIAHSKGRSFCMVDIRCASFHCCAGSFSCHKKRCRC
jgi:hypothetical protein